MLPCWLRADAGLAELNALKDRPNWAALGPPTVLRHEILREKVLFQQKTNRAMGVRLAEEEAQLLDLARKR